MKLIREIYPLEEFKKQSKYFVFVKINTDHQSSVASAYRVTALPTLIIMRPDGSVVHQWLGFKTLPGILAEMDRGRGMAGH
ncbi:MAG TPA: thioredoxin family protein, partial [Fimbriimonadaceae bacterium]|nr:thioredoxin family protein [Fimbriimonadaceae bacterium]